MLNNNPVLVARHFQYQVENFFLQLLMKSNLLGKVLYYSIRVEYQLRGSPHIHSFLWIKDPPKLDANNFVDYITFVDKNIKCYLPDEVNQTECCCKKVPNAQTLIVM